MAKRRKEKPIRCSASLVLIDAIALVLLIACVFCPGYHVNTIAYITTATLTIDAGLLRVRIYGRCRGLFGRMMPSALVKACEYLVTEFRDSSLRELEIGLCQVENMLFNVFSTGCDSVRYMVMASMILLTAIAVTALLLLIGLVSLLSVNFTRGSRLTRSIIMYVHAAQAVTITLGLIVYLMVGSTTMTLGELPLNLSYDVTLLDLGLGFGVAVVTVVWCVMIPVWIYAAHPEYRKQTGQGYAELRRLSSLDSALEDLDDLTYAYMTPQQQPYTAPRQPYMQPAQQTYATQQPYAHVQQPYFAPQQPYY